MTTGQTNNAIHADGNSAALHPSRSTKVNAKFFGYLCGMSLGLMFGVAIGIAIDVLAAGFGIGLCFGTSLGLLFSRLFGSREPKGQQDLGGDSENRAEDGTVPGAPQG